MRASSLIVGCATLILFFVGQPVGSQTLVPVGVQGQVNTYTSSYQRHPAVEIDARGFGVVVWDSFGSSGSDATDASIQGQRFALPHIFSDGFESGDTTGWSSSVP